MPGKVLPHLGFLPWAIYLTAVSDAVGILQKQPLPKGNIIIFLVSLEPRVSSFTISLPSLSSSSHDRRVSAIRDVFTQLWVHPLLDYVQDLIAFL